jgi:hypothetical protein
VWADISTLTLYALNSMTFNESVPDVPLLLSEDWHPIGGTVAASVKGITILMRLALARAGRLVALSK